MRLVMLFAIYVAMKYLMPDVEFSEMAKDFIGLQEGRWFLNLFMIIWCVLVFAADMRDIYK